MHISDRLQQAAASQTVKLDTIAKQLIRDGKPVINLTAGELDFETSPVVLAAAKAAIDGNFNHYSSPQGSMELRLGITKYLLNTYNLHYTPEQILVTNGVKQALYSALQTCVNPGDEVLVPMPGWVSYMEQIRLAGGVPVAVETNDNGVIEIETIRNAVTERTVGIMLNSPANPTGVVIAKNILQSIADLARERELWVMSDEIYDQLLYNNVEVVPFAQLYPEGTITVNGLSKAGAMTGWRVGFVAGPEEIILNMTKLQSHLCGNVNNISQQAALAALTDVQVMIPQYMEALEERRSLVLKWVEATPYITCILPQGAFYCFVDIRTVMEDSEQFCKQLLEEYNVAIVPGVYFGRDGYVRISFANNTEQLTQALVNIAMFIASHT